MRYKLPGLKQRDLENCVCCGRGMAHDGSISFLRVSIQQMLLNPLAIHRQTGLEMALGGGTGQALRDRMAATVAEALGPDEDMAVPVHAPAAVLVCQDCSLHDVLLVVHEKAVEIKRPEENVPL